MSGFNTKINSHGFTLLEVILAMFILAGALTALLGERQRSLQHSRQVIEHRQALSLASELMEQSQSLKTTHGVLTIPEDYHVDIQEITFNIAEWPSQYFIERTISVATPSGEKFQLSRVINP